MKLLKRYALYLLRWQLSTPIIAVVLMVLGGLNTWVATIIANFIGGLMFFWIDNLIFRKNSNLPLWEIKNKCKCADCGNVTKGYRIVEWGKYDRREDSNPEYRCQECSLKKMKTIKAKC